MCIYMNRRVFKTHCIQNYFNSRRIISGELEEKHRGVEEEEEEENTRGIVKNGEKGEQSRKAKTGHGSR